MQIVENIEALFLLDCHLSPFPFSGALGRHFVRPSFSALTVESCKIGNVSGRGFIPLLSLFWVLPHVPAQAFLVDSWFFYIVHVLWQNPGTWWYSYDSQCFISTAARMGTWAQSIVPLEKPEMTSNLMFHLHLMKYIEKINLLFRVGKHCSKELIQKVWGGCLFYVWC